MTTGILVLAAAAVRAERPFDTEDVVPLAPGHVQAEVSAGYAHGPHDVDLGVFTQVVTVGVAPNLDVAAQSSQVVAEVPRRVSQAGIGDTVVYSKYLIVDQAPGRPAFLVSPLVRLPTAEDSLGLSGVDVQVLGAVAKTVGAWDATGNVGYTFVTADRRRDLWTVAASLEWAPTPVWMIGAEGVTNIGTSGDYDAAYLRAGAAITVRSGVRLDAGVACGVHGIFPDVLVTVGATIDLF